MSENEHSPANSAPEFQFGDPTTPARVCYLLREEVISPKDLIILWVVNALVRHQGDQGGIGCYATNKYLGRAARAHPVYVSSRIQVLEELGLLLVVYLDGRRYLETEWSRTAEEREALDGPYGEECRKAHNAILERLEGKGGALGGKAKPLGGGKAKPLGEPNKGSKIEGAARRPPISPKTSPKSTPTTPPQFCVEWAKRLRTILRSRKKSIPVGSANLLSEAGHFLQLWKTDLSGDESAKSWVEQLLADYSKYIDRVEKPVVRNAAQLRKCAGWLRDELDKLIYPRSGRSSGDNSGNGFGGGDWNRLREDQIP